MLYFFQNNVAPQFFNGMVCWYYHLQWICGYVHVYKIIKQLFHACSGNSQNYCPSVLEMTWELLANCLRPNIAMLFVQICGNYTSEGGCAMVMGNNWLVPWFQDWRTMITLNISKLRSSRNLSLSYDIVVKIYIYIQ